MAKEIGLSPSPFATGITIPLGHVLGSRLQSVEYGVLSSDMPTFDVNDANGSGGCQRIRLRFDSAALLLTWDWQQELRDSDREIAYHLTICEDSSEMPNAPWTSSPPEEFVGVGTISATEAAPWCAARDEPLIAATVWGFTLTAGSKSPQAVTLAFPSGRITIALGALPTVDDHDELLIFHEAAWEEILAGAQPPRSASGRYPLEHLWTS